MKNDEDEGLYITLADADDAVQSASPFTSSATWLGCLLSNIPAMPISTATVFGRRAMNTITAADYADWATEMLTDGYDSPNLRILAGLDERGSVFEAEEHFTRALRELQIPEPDSPGKLRAYGIDLAQQILDGRLSPEAGVKALYQLCLATRAFEEIL